ncbi:MAG: glutathione-regulated potassium-efflux system protein KefC [Methanobacterium sp. PtaU1.Bin242]|nr:MAG: glutathione-regulated potassium-efflux system protein KefC [Methanobacterium sp. PtaU1.Bin242]
MVELTGTFYNLFIIFIAAILAPIVASVIPRFKFPVVVLEICLGIIIGPQVLGLVHLDPVINELSQFGLGFLFFLAGFEIDIDRLKGKPLTYAVIGWIISLIIALIIGGILQTSGLVISFIFIALAISTTAVGVLVPILRDEGDLNSNFGRFVFSAGVVGEFAPLAILALFFNKVYNNFSSLILILIFILIAVTILFTVRRWQPPYIVDLMRKTMNNSGQLALRLSLLLLVALIFITMNSGIDFLFGAFTAGIILSEVIKMAKNKDDKDIENMRIKFEGIGFGLLIPIFFVVSGINFDLKAFLTSPTSLLMVPIFIISFLIVRGFPAMVIYRKILSKAERVPLALFSATQLPMVIVITNLAVKSGTMHTNNAADLVGAAIMSVILFPFIALIMRNSKTKQKVGSDN